MDEWRAGRGREGGAEEEGVGRGKSSPAGLEGWPLLGFDGSPPAARPGAARRRGLGGRLAGGPGTPRGTPGACFASWPTEPESRIPEGRVRWAVGPTVVRESRRG